MGSEDLHWRLALRFIRQIAALLFIVALPVAIVTTNVRVAMNEPRVYNYAIDHYDAVETTGIPRAELVRASGELRSYFNNEEDRLFVRVVDEGQSIALFNEREVAHLSDVKTLVQAVFRVQEGAIVFVIAYVVMVFLWAREGNLRRLAREMLVSGGAALAVLAAFGAIVLMGFETAFDRFHVIAFTNGNWKFDPRSDHLIQMFPEAFWEDVTLWVSLATLAELALLSAAAAVVLRLTSEQRIRTVKVTGTLPARSEGVEA
jgi:integral membrane protein (TIGR01906 family)